MSRRLPPCARGGGVGGGGGCPRGGGGGGGGVTCPKSPGAGGNLSSGYNGGAGKVRSGSLCIAPPGAGGGALLFGVCSSRGLGGIIARSEGAVNGGGGWEGLQQRALWGKSGGPGQRTRVQPAAEHQPRAGPGLSSSRCPSRCKVVQEGLGNPPSQRCSATPVPPQGRGEGNKVDHVLHQQGCRHGLNCAVGRRRNQCHAPVQTHGVVRGGHEAARRSPRRRCGVAVVSWVLGRQPPLWGWAGSWLVLAHRVSQPNVQCWPGHNRCARCLAGTCEVRDLRRSLGGPFWPRGSFVLRHPKALHGAQTNLQTQHQTFLPC